MAKTHIFDVALAEIYGPIESIILSHLCYWIEKNAANQNNFHKGRYWTYNSAAAFEKIFSYLNGKQIRRVLDKLEEKGALYIDSFNKIGYDRTLWYSVSDEVMGIYNAGKKNEPPNRPNGQMHIPNSGDASDQTGITAQTGKWEENGEKSAGIGEGEGDKAAAAKMPETVRPNGQMHVPNSGNASDQTGKCISQNLEIDLPNLGNRSPESGSPIPDINQYKPSASDSSEEKETQTEPFKKMFLDIDRRFAFSVDFYETARAVTARTGFGEGYCRWLYRECLAMGPDNIRALYYKLFGKEEMLELYQSTRAAGEEGAGSGATQCPACGAAVGRGLSECPSCKMNMHEAHDESLVEYHKRYLALSDEQKNDYFNELCRVKDMLGQIPTAEYLAMLQEAEERYGLAPSAKTAVAGGV
jgi:hypothetical protein